jgi:S1-C subfamily serine protease
MRSFRAVKRTLLLLTCGLAAGAALLAGGASGAGRDVSAPVNPAVVDVNVTLGYEGGAAAGTGIVLTSTGRVLTNNHVIRGATSVKVTDVGNGRTYAAKVVGYDVASDVAVLQLENASGLSTVTTRSSSTVKVGEPVTAVGNAGGAEGTPSSSSGHVRALNQPITASDGDGNSERLTGLIETDAQLQPGDSGGPLVDGNGRVIGMDTAASSSFEFQGASHGYAIPINHALALAARIVAGHGSSTTHIGATPLLGVDVQLPGSDPLNFSGYSQTSPGALVTDVLPGSPADHAGIGSGDVITAVAGRKVSSPDALTNVLLHYAPNAKVAVVWIDGSGATQHASVRLAVGPPR